jgi:hypothetical protein
MSRLATTTTSQQCSFEQIGFRPNSTGCREACRHCSLRMGWQLVEPHGPKGSTARQKYDLRRVNAIFIQPLRHPQT